MSKLLKRETYYWPVEISDYEKQCIESIVDKKLSMTGRGRLVALAMAVRYVAENKIPGDFVECGVWRGGAAILAQKLFYHYGDKNRKFYLYDTFTGMTEPSNLDKDASTEKLAKLFNPGLDEQGLGWCECSIDDVKSNIVSEGGDLSAYNLIMGDVCDTLRNEIPHKCAILRLDTDWYESTRIEMEVLYPRLVQGGVLHVDDYGHWTGSRRAVDEYFENHGKYQKPLFSVVDKSCRSAIKGGT